MSMGILDPSTWEVWQQYLFQGIVIAIQLTAAAIVLGRTGRTPYWALLTLVPFFFVLVIGIWGLAYCRWPKHEKQAP